jgi:hypothetical protein
VGAVVDNVTNWLLNTSYSEIVLVPFHRLSDRNRTTTVKSSATDVQLMFISLVLELDLSSHSFQRYIIPRFFHRCTTLILRGLDLNKSKPNLDSRGTRSVVQRHIRYAIE